MPEIPKKIKLPTFQDMPFKNSLFGKKLMADLKIISQPYFISLSIVNIVLIVFSKSIPTVSQYHFIEENLG